MNKNEIAKMQFRNMIDSLSIESIELIEQLLTPPTEEEVCKALSEYLNRKVTYYNRCFMYQFSNYIGDGKFYIVIQEHYNTIHFDCALPLDIIKMLGRFYEVMNNE